jgi:hypothetical protein
MDNPIIKQVICPDCHGDIKIIQSINNENFILSCPSCIKKWYLTFTAKKGEGLLDHDTYISERKELYKYQQTCYDNYEKTLTALTSSFLAFSIGLIGYLKSSEPKATPVLVPDTNIFLYTSWITFSLSLVVLLLCFFTNAKAYTVEMQILKKALTDSKALMESNNYWTNISVILYFLTTIFFMSGLISLLFFCFRNFL